MTGRLNGFSDGLWVGNGVYFNRRHKRFAFQTACLPYNGRRLRNRNPTMKQTNFLDTLARMQGDMEWPAADGRMPSEKTLKLANAGTIAAIPVFALLFFLGTALPENGILRFASFAAAIALPVRFFWFVGIRNRRHTLAEMQQTVWRFKQDTRTLVWTENGETVAEYPLQNGDRLLADRPSALFADGDQYGDVLVLEYRRPYPAQHIRLFSYIHSRKNDYPPFETAAQNIARQLGLPLDSSGW